MSRRSCLLFLTRYGFFFLSQEFQKAREKFFAGNRVSDEKAFNELLAMENLDGRVPFNDFVAQQERVLVRRYKKVFRFFLELKRVMVYEGWRNEAKSDVDDPA